MCRLLGAVLCSLALVFAAPRVSARVLAAPPLGRPAPVCPSGVSVCNQAAPSGAPQRPHPPARPQAPPSVSLSVATGYSEQYRSSAWVPVHVTVHNLTPHVQEGM